MCHGVSGSGDPDRARERLEMEMLSRGAISRKCGSASYGRLPVLGRGQDRLGGAAGSPWKIGRVDRDVMWFIHFTGWICFTPIIMLRTLNRGRHVSCWATSPLRVCKPDGCEPIPPKRDLVCNNEVKSRLE
jgi:hypothetical protein